MSKSKISQISIEIEMPKAKYKKNIKTNGRFCLHSVNKHRRNQRNSGQNGREYAAGKPHKLLRGEPQALKTNRSAKPPEGVKKSQRGRESQGVKVTTRENDCPPCPTELAGRQTFNVSGLSCLRAGGAKNEGKGNPSNIPT